MLQNRGDAERAARQTPGMKRALVILSWSIAAALGSAAAKPNIVVIMADDFGYECVGANGGESYRTPVLDRMAAEGMRFEHCYSQPICTPSRVKLMTGRSNIRNYVKFGVLARLSRLGSI